MAGGYQQQVFNSPAIGIPGDFADANARMSLIAGPGGLIAGPSGVVVGNFAWVTPPTDPNGSNQVANSFGQGNVAGFVYNDTQALNTVFLSDGTLVIPEGLPVALAVQGDFLVINAGTTEAQVGMKAYATFGTGAVTFAATGSPTSGATSTGSTTTQTTNAITASIAGDVLSITVAAGTVYAGSVITVGTGVAPGTTITAQITPLLAGESVGGIGRYLLSVSQQKSIVSESMTLTYSVLTIGTATGTFLLNQTLTGTTIGGTGSSIWSYITGTGGSGSTMVINYTGASLTSQVIDTVSNVETKWYCANSGGPGQTIKMTSWVGSQG